MLKLFEYKIYEWNKYNNIILYENNLRLNNLTTKKYSKFNPKVSIIIPVYNGSKFMSEAIQSALNQTYKNIEIIVVNDGSTDNTDIIAKSYGNQIHYYTKNNGGVSSALNLGIKKMRGEYFAWLSHDDIYFPNNIEEHIRFLKHTTERDIITFTNFNMIDENSNVLISETIMANLYCFDYKMSIVKPEYSLLQGEINGGSVLIPRRAFSKCGLFNEKLKISQERDMWSRLMKSYKFINIPIETTSIRNHPAQVTRTNSSVDFESNTKILEIINNLDTKTMQNLEGSEYDFYNKMEYYYSLHGRENLEYAMEAKKKELNKLNERKYNKK